MNARTSLAASVLAPAMLAMLLVPLRGAAHCDTLDGPVVAAARQALETGNVNLVLSWVQPDDEAEIGRAFEQTLSVRKLGAEAKDLADRYFFETLVRVHRTGEGAPYTGLKPAGADLGPAIPAADRALETGDLKPVLKLLTEALQNGLHSRFAQAAEKRKSQKDNVAAGRAYVRAYVTFIHYVEGVYEAARNGGAVSGHEAAPASAAGVGESSHNVSRADKPTHQ